MSIKSQPIDWDIKGVIETLLQINMDGKYFGVRKVLNEEKVLFLQKSKDFANDIAEIKKEFSVPKLNPNMDYILIEQLDYEIEDSNWLTEQGNNIIDRWENRIRQLLDKYKLPISFRDWVEYNVLYGKPKNYPHYNIEEFAEIIRDPQEAHRLGLTTSEKKLLLAGFRQSIKWAKKDEKALLRDHYLKVRNSLLNSKNSRRRSRTVNTAIKSLNMGKKSTYFDSSVGASGKNITHKTTSSDLATTVFGDETGKKAALVRKQKERLLKRHIRTPKVEN